MGLEAQRTDHISEDFLPFFLNKCSCEDSNPTSHLAYSVPNHDTIQSLVFAPYLFILTDSNVVINILTHKWF